MFSEYVGEYRDGEYGAWRVKISLNVSEAGVSECLFWQVWGMVGEWVRLEYSECTGECRI